MDRQTLRNDAVQILEDLLTAGFDTQSALDHTLQFLIMAPRLADALVVTSILVEVARELHVDAAAQRAADKRVKGYQ